MTTMEVSTQWHCSLCPKSFGRKGDLTRHKLLHAGIKRHICTICNKAFSQYSGLKTHKNVHTKVKPFVCGFNSCSASFGDPSSCARHRKETHRRMGAYRCPYPMCKSSIKRRSAFANHLKKHNIDVTYVDIDSMAPPLPPIAVSVPKRESVPEIKAIDAMAQRRSEAQRFVEQARQMCSDANESSFYQSLYHQTPIPWTHYEDSGIMASESTSTLPFSIPNSFNYDNIDLGSESLLPLDPPSRLLGVPINLISSSQSKPSFESGESVIKTEDEKHEMISSSSFKNLKSMPLAYPFSHFPNIYPDFKHFWVQPTSF